MDIVVFLVQATRLVLSLLRLCVGFQVEVTSGTVTAKQPISYWLFQTMTFTVVATDGGFPALNATAPVSISVLEAGSHEPRFDPDFISLDLRSDKAVGSEVARVTAIHPGTGKTATITETRSQ